MAQKEKSIHDTFFSNPSISTDSLQIDNVLMRHHLAHDSTASIEVSMLFQRAFAERFALFKHKIRDQYPKHMLRFVEHNRWSVRDVVEGVAQASSEEKGFHSSDLNYEQSKCLANALAHKMIRIIDVYCMRKDSLVMQCDLTYNIGGYTHAELIAEEVLIWFNKFFAREKVHTNAMNNLFIHMLAESVQEFMESQLGIVMYTRMSDSLEESKMEVYAVLNEIKVIIKEVIGVPHYYDNASLEQLMIIEHIAQAIAGIALTASTKELPYLRKRLQASDIKKHRREIVHTIGVMRQLASQISHTRYAQAVLMDEEQDKIVLT